MNGIVLTPEQQEFAAEYHNLIYAFLNKKKLHEDDYYDIVVFGFLHAVKRYFEESELRKYSFSTIAWRSMDSSLANYYKNLNRQKRHCYILSLDSILSNGDFLPVEETVAVPDSQMMQLETELLLHELASRVSRRQMNVIRMKADGYGVKEIAREQKTSIRDVRELLESVYGIVLEVCCR
ncbi:sigma-70 RNA polymerase sigma factor region 4 domain-containing protein [Anaerocolumna xylanovorans]|uniref:RNA polymerase sigma-70 factor, ECF subfamily n=1 Tax=Anaerocolumna xylanovorans DSM 12503 TaxID=1121345 RepID=A0A1M7YNG0_9FIRM|nr:response regulator transcription factor [Anaerocolumna xylanovorans]SHO54162.1 RNA polymerase sigma-70 factor, ECF subfamily [Anaerocolumna xylanovorans DSM 12503]